MWFYKENICYENKNIALFPGCVPLVNFFSCAVYSISKMFKTKTLYFGIVF